MGRSGVACALALLALAGCGGSEPLSQACMEAQPDDVLRALHRAPGRVALADGTPLSQCVRRTVDDTRLQVLGAVLVAAADRLARRARDRDDDAAYRLGFLIGATARGSDQAAGLQGELANRIAGTAELAVGARRAALLRGRADGQRGG